MSESSSTPTDGNQPSDPPGSAKNPYFFVADIPQALQIKQVENPLHSSNKPTQKAKPWFVLPALATLAILIVGLFVSFHYQLYTLAIVFAAMALSEFIGLLIYLGYTNATWTGFGPNIRPEDRDHQPEMLWDWLALLIIPVVLAAGAVGFGAFQNQENYNLNQSQFNLAATQYVENQSLAQEQQVETNLQTYLDRMSDLLLNSDLHSNDQQGINVRILATARTLTILEDLNASRKATVLKFLHNAGLINRQMKNSPQVDPVVNLNSADFSNVNLTGFDLSGADLAFVNFSGATLNQADLSGAYLAGVSLRGATLIGTNLAGSQLFNQQLDQPPETADLTDANLFLADMRGANLIQANLTNADLSAAIVDHNTDFTHVIWKHTTCRDGSDSDSFNPPSCEGHEY